MKTPLIKKRRRKLWKLYLTSAPDCIRIHFSFCFFFATRATNSFPANKFVVLVLVPPICGLKMSEQIRNMNFRTLIPQGDAQYIYWNSIRLLYNCHISKQEGSSMVSYNFLRAGNGWKTPLHLLLPCPTPNTTQNLWGLNHYSSFALAMSHP